jgi:chromosome segregation ATPase
MNRTRKLRGGDNLTLKDRKELAELSIRKLIAYRVKMELDNLRSKINDYYRSNNIENDDLLNIDKLVNLEYNAYIDSFKTSNDAIEAIQRAKDMKPLEKHYNNVKGIATLLLKTIDQAKELKKSKVAIVPTAVLPQPPPVTSPVAQVLPPPPPVTTPVIQNPPNIVGNLLAEIDILKSELISKDIILEETNKKLVTAFYYLSEHEDNASRSSGSVSSTSKNAELDALSQTIQKQEADIARQAEVIKQHTAENAELVRLRQTTEDQTAEIARHIETIGTEAGKAAVQAQNIATKTLRIYELERNVGGKEGQIDGLTAELEKIREENKVLNITVGERDVTIAGLRAQIAVPVPVVNPNEAQIKQLQDANAELLAKNNALEVQLKDERDTIAILGVELDTAKQTNARVTGELGVATKRIAELEKELGDEKVRNTSLGAELAASKLSIIDLEGKLGVATNRIAELEGKLGVATNRIQSLERDLGVATNRIAKLEGEISDLKAFSVATDANIPNLEQRIRELTAIKNKLEKELREQTEYVKQIKIELSQAANHIAYLKAEVDTPFNEVSLNSTLSAKPKVIDHALILRHTLFNDLKVLIENIKQNNKYDIISSLNEIIESFNQLYLTNQIQLLSKPSNTTQINEKIRQLYDIIKPK